MALHRRLSADSGRKSARALGHRDQPARAARIERAGIIVARRAESVRPALFRHRLRPGLPRLRKQPLGCLRRYCAPRRTEAVARQSAYQTMIAADPPRMTAP